MKHLFFVFEHNFNFSARVITKDIEKNIAKLRGCFTSRTDILLRKLIAKTKNARPLEK